MIALAFRHPYLRVALLVSLFVALLALPHLGYTQADEETNLAERQPRAYVPILIASVRTTPTRTPIAPTATPTPTSSSQNNPLRGIYGLVNDTGKGAGLVDVELMITSDEIEWTTVRASRTDSRGYYSFTDAPPLPSGQKYAVHYVNTGNSKRLDLWVTHRLITYTAEANINMGSFDVANIELDLPAANTTIGLPNTFKWKIRSGRNEKYQLSIFTFPDGDITDYISPPVDGGSFVLNTETLPPHYVPLLTYAWEVWVTEPAGLHTAQYEEGYGYGVSYEKRAVIFNNLLR